MYDDARTASVVSGVEVRSFSGFIPNSPSLGSSGQFRSVTSLHRTYYGVSYARLASSRNWAVPGVGVEGMDGEVESSDVEDMHQIYSDEVYEALSSS